MESSAPEQVAVLHCCNPGRTGRADETREKDVNGTLAPELTTADRCDRCGAQAFVRARLAGGFELLFCAHHGREHLNKLRDLEDVQISDESHRLQPESTNTDAIH